MQETNRFFATAKPVRLFFIVAIPGMVSMLAASIYSIIEGVFIGHLLGEAAFAAVNIAMPFVMINFSLADLIGVGSSVQISIALGHKDHARANNYFSCSLLLILLAAVFMGVLLYFTSPYLVTLMGAEGELASLAVRYVRVYALLGPVTTFIFAVDNYLRISGFVKGSMILNIFMSCLTAALIFLFLGVLKMDVDGAAFATCCSMSLCVLIALTPFLRGKAVLHFVRPRMNAVMVREIVSCGTPVFLNNIAGRVASIVMNSALLRIGGQTAVAAYSVLMYAGGIVEPMLYGTSDSTQPAVGYNWGAQALERVRDIAKCAFLACGTISLLGTGIMFFFAEPVTRLFVGADESALLTMSVHALRLFCLAYLTRWFSFAAQGFLSAIEKPLQASLLSICNAMVFPVLFVFVFSPLGLDGLWLNLAATSLVVALLAVWLLLAAQRRMRQDIRRKREPNVL